MHSLETTYSHYFAIFSSLAANNSLSDAVKSVIVDLLVTATVIASGDVAGADDDVVIVFAGVVVTVAAVDSVASIAALGVLPSALVGIMVAVVVGLALVFVGMVVVIGSRDDKMEDMTAPTRGGYPSDSVIVVDICQMKIYEVNAVRAVLVSCFVSMAITK